MFIKFQLSILAVASNVCSPSPCQNSGICYVSGTGTAACYCPPGTFYPYCSSVSSSMFNRLDLFISNWIIWTLKKIVEVCLTNPCLNGGTCYLNDFSQPSCICPPGSSYPYCQKGTLFLFFYFSNEFIFISLTNRSSYHCVMS